MGRQIRRIVAIFLALGLIYSLSKNIFEYHKKITFYQTYEKELEAQKKKQLQLKSEIAKSKDYYLVEKNIREKLNLLKPDEIEVILPKPTIFPTPTPVVKKPALRQWIEVFF